KPIHARPRLGNNYVLPRNRSEQLLAGIWQKLLGLEEVGIHDNFFDLGGHSLLATQMMSRVREAFQVDLALRVLFEAPTVAELALRVEQRIANAGELAERIEEAHGEEQRLLAPPILPVSRDKDLPLSFSQQRLWFVG